MGNEIQVMLYRGSARYHRGSILGSLLFLNIINSLKTVVGSHFIQAKESSTIDKSKQSVCRGFDGNSLIRNMSKSGQFWTIW